jgi:hypothetical protein
VLEGKAASPKAASSAGEAEHDPVQPRLDGEGAWNSMNSISSETSMTIVHRT